ncbi:MAG: sugar transferase, partial [Bacteroidia bacterium]
MDSYSAKTSIESGDLEEIVALEQIVLPAPRFVEISRQTQYAIRLCDIVIALILVVCMLSWLFPLLAIIIRLSSKGPVIFIQQRIGRHNKIFSCYKFRTMYVNYDADLREATQNDERITPVGNCLRKLFIDELPQLVNVLLGEMSMVGPRPHMLFHHEKFSSIIPYYKERHKIKPGITGLAQIKGFRGSVAEFYQINGRTKLDLFYIKK